MLWFMYKTYVPSRGVVWNGDVANLIYVNDKQIAVERYKKYEKQLKPLEFVIPPKTKIIVNIPIVKIEEDGEWYEEDMEFEKSLYRKHVDPIMRAVVERMLKYVYVTKDWLFVERDSDTGRKFDSVNMEKLQSMKDIMMGLFRVTPIQINVWTKKEPKYIDWIVWSDARWIKYTVWGKEYKTNMFGLYAGNFRDKMFPHSEEMSFYGWHWLEYRQRDARLRSWYVTTIAASRNLGKTLLVHHDAGLHLVREKVFKTDKTQEFAINYFGLDLRNLAKYMHYITNMFYNLLSGTFEKDILKNILKVDKSTTDLSLRFYDWEDERVMRYISQNQESRGWRTVLGIIDEWAYHKTNEAMDFLTGAWFAPIWDISTIQEGMPMNDFYKRWSSAYIKTKQYKPIDEIIHTLWVKYWFDKCTKPEDYLKMAKEWVFDECRIELFDELPVVWLKYTIDEAEHYTDKQRDIIINSALERRWSNYMMAELFAELTGSSPAIRYMHAINTNRPERYDKIFIGYDEADDFDQPGICAIWVAGNKAYIIHSEVLPADVDQRYVEFKHIVSLYENKCREVIIIADCTRWWAVRREIFDRVGQLNYAVKRTTGKGSNSVNLQKDYLHMGKWYIVNLVNDELFLKDRISIYDWLDVDWWLTRELQLFIKRKWDVYAASSGKDDQVCAMLLAAYCAYEHLKQNIIRNIQYEEADDSVEARVHAKKHEREELERGQKLNELMNNIR